VVSFGEIGQDAVTTRVFGPHFCGAARRDKLVALVERVLELHKRSPRLSQEQEIVKPEIRSTDGRIARLSEEDMKILEP
jgi:hypothetical protein